jgi:hypothetical protein
VAKAGNTYFANPSGLGESMKIKQFSGKTFLACFGVNYGLVESDPSTAIQGRQFSQLSRREYIVTNPQATL